VCTRSDPHWGCAADSCTPCALANVVDPSCSLHTGGGCDYKSCAEGWMDLDGVRSNGCEAIAGCYVGQKTCPGGERCLSDPTSGCGGTSCSACPWPPSGQGEPTCASSGSGFTCALKCHPGYKACGGDCVRATPQVGCSEPGCVPCSERLENVVASTIVCSGSGKCDYGLCKQGYEDLDGNRANGCETANPRAVRIGRLQVWFRGDRGLSTDSYGEVLWRDQGPWGNDAYGVKGTQRVEDEEGYVTECYRTTGPSIGTNFHGTPHPFVRFSTANSGYARTKSSLEAITGGPYTLIVVGGRMTDAQLRFAVGMGVGCVGKACRNTILSLGYRDNTRYTFDQQENGLDVPVAPYPGGVQVHRAVARFDDTVGHTLRVTSASGQVQEASNSNLEPFNPIYSFGKELLIGISPAAYKPMNGGVAELIVYDVALTDAEIVQVEAYLKKWGF
jgi:hypothetical protein